MSKRLIVSLEMAALFAVAMGAVSTQAADQDCRAAVPTYLTARPTRWLGECRAGQAEGLGVLRAGAAEPYQFFFGLMRGGKPLRGLLRGPDEGWEEAASFDVRGHNVSTSNPVAFDSLYKLATAASRATAQRFAAAGNRGSAVYYQRLANKIRDGEPE